MMGYSMRTDRFRYTEWVHRETKEIKARELYDHKNQLEETINIAEGPEQASVVAKLSEELHAAIPGSRRKVKIKVNASSGISTGFENFKTGLLNRTKDQSGAWEAKKRPCRNSKQRIEGREKKALHILGGEAKQAVWTPVASEKPVDHLEFWYERWTRKQPFDFRVDGFVRGKWKTLHHNKGKAAIGAFRNHVVIKLNEPRPKKFRFISTHPKRKWCLD